MVKAAVGTRPSSVCEPHTFTPLIDCSPSSRWENTSASAAANWSMSSSMRKRAAASMPAMPSKLGMPVSSRPGPVSVAGRTLNTGRLSSNSGRSTAARCAGRTTCRET